MSPCPSIQYQSLVFTTKTQRCNLKCESPQVAIWGITALLECGGPSPLASFWRETSPQGRLRKAQGASPGNKDSNNGSPERGDAVSPGTRDVPYDERLSGVEMKLPAPPFQGFANSGP